MDGMAFLCMKLPGTKPSVYFRKSYVSAFRDPSLNLVACGYVDLFNIHHHWNYERASAPYWCLYWNRKPGAAVMAGKRRIALGPAAVVLIAPHTVYSTSNRGHCDQLFVHFQLITPHAGLQPQAHVVAADSCLEPLLQKMVSVMNRGEAGRWEFSMLARALVELALSRVVDRNLALPEMDPRIQAAVAYIGEHINASLSNPDLARQAGMSLSAFMRLFREQVGHAPHGYLALKRVEKACIMLHHSGASIKQIAEETGFCDRYHFTRVFKLRQGMGPAEFRARNLTPFRPYKT